MLKLETVADLENLIDEGISESLTLECKASDALGKTDGQKNELCKDVTAFANAAGGQIIYGVKDDRHAPSALDDGADPAITKEWIGQVIDSRVQPRIEGLVITPIRLARGLGFVLTIPQALGRAPHQAPDKRYYKRQNFQSVAMEDYEIRDALRRSTTPDLYVELSFGTGPTAHIEFPRNVEISVPITIVVHVANRSSQPAYHALGQIGVDTALPLHASPQFQPLGMTGFDQHQYWLGYRFTSPPGLPIFKELGPDAAHRLTFTVQYPAQLLRGEHLFHLTSNIQCPGFSASENWKIHHRGTTLTMCPPGHPMNR